MPKTVVIPPGTGKPLLAQAITNYIDGTFYTLSAADLYPAARLAPCASTRSSTWCSPGRTLQ